MNGHTLLRLLALQFLDRPHDHPPGLPAQATELVEELVAWRPARVVGLSVDGNEAAAGRTEPRFAEAFRRAGLKRTVYAGESSGPEGVRDAVELLGADRIDHGVRAIEDERVVALLA